MRFNAALIIVACAALWSRDSLAESSGSSECFGDKNLKVCPLHLNASADGLGMKIAGGPGVDVGDSDFKFGASVAPGAYFAWEKDPATDTRPVYFIGNVTTSLMSEPVVAMLGGHIDVTQVAPKTAAGEGPRSFVRKYGGSLLVGGGGHVYGQDEGFLGGWLNVGVHGTKTDQGQLALSKAQYDKELTLSMVESRPMRKEEVSGLLADGELGFTQQHAANHDSSDTFLFFDDLRLATRGSLFPGGSPYLGWHASVRVVVGMFPWGSPLNDDDRSGAKRRDGWLELHVLGAGSIAATPDASIFLLPSLGGSDHMRTMAGGTYPARGVLSGSAQLGTSFVRFAVETGRAFSDPDQVSRVGFAGVLALPRTWQAGMMGRMHSVKTIMPQQFELCIGKALGERFALSAKFGF
jgi:hypothetical protein